MMHARLAVIVLTFDNFDDTVECLVSVLSSHYRDFELLLVDNHSTDGSSEKLRARFPDIHHLRNEANLGVAGGRNAGWKWVREQLAADTLLFLDNDTVLEPETIGRLVTYLDERPEVALVSGKAYTAPPSRTLMSAGMRVNLYTGSIGDIGSGETDTGQYDDARSVAACGGFCFMVRRTAFEALGGLDEGYNPYGWEDVDFCLRASQRGHECHYVPQAIVYHKGCKIGRGYVPHYEKYKTRHLFRLLLRHTNPLQRLCWGSVIVVRGAFVLGRLLLQGEGRIAAAQLSGAWGVLAGGRQRAR
jgi:GT2 family glycosyltransferase